jgi:hypothetical protein
MSYSVVSFRQSVNKSLPSLVADMNTYFAGTPGSVISVDTSRRLSARKSEYLAIRVLYQTGIPAPTYSAYLVTGSTTLTFEDSFNTFAAINPNLQIRHIARVEEPQVRVNTPTQMVVIGTLESALDYSTDPIVVVPTGGIASGASGSATAYNATGASLGTVTVKNVGSAAWTAGQSSVAIYDLTAGLYYAVAPS